MTNVLIVEDEQAIRRFLRTALEGDGMRVFEAETLQRGLLEAATRKPDLIILDLGLPDGDGIEFIRDLRQWSAVPVIVLSARSEESDKIAALDAGADDYLVKPFSFQELEARIKALLRRSKEVPVQQLVCGDLILDCTLRRARRGNMDIDLTVKEYRLLEYFLLHQRAVLSRLTLLRDVWDKNFDTNTNVVDVYVNYLRAKIDKGFEDKLIHTVVGVGYMMTD